MCLKICTLTLFFVSHQMLLRSINAVLIVLSVLELCVVISSAVLGIKALRSSEKKKNEVKYAKSYLTVKPAIYPRKTAGTQMLYFYLT